MTLHGCETKDKLMSFINAIIQELRLDPLESELKEHKFACAIFQQLRSYKSLLNGIDMILVKLQLDDLVLMMKLRKDKNHNIALLHAMLKEFGLTLSHGKINKWCRLQN